MRPLQIILPFLQYGSRPTEKDSGRPSEVPFYGQSLPVYPSPVGDGTSNTAWAAAYRRASALVSQMTLDEKVSLTRGFPGPCTGNSGPIVRLGIPSLCFADGPANLHGQEFVSAFPAGIHTAATFDQELMYQLGAALGAEFRGRGVNVALGPVAGPLGRIAVGGRNWEGLSNDPYLAGVGLGSITKGMQDSGVIATPKHFLLNEQELRRRSSPLGEAISSNVGDRALRELYAWPFMDALRAGAGAVMCSYQRANQSYACQNSKLLNGVLKTELKFEGFVVSDWDAQTSGVASANAGMDVVMPGAGWWGKNLTEAVKNGSVTAARMDDMARRVLAPWILMEQQNMKQQNSLPERTIYSNTQMHLPVDVQAGHASLIRKIGAAGTVLVKNDKGALPLRNPRYVFVYGYDAVIDDARWSKPDPLGGEYNRNLGWSTHNGTLISGGGSGGTTPPYVISPFHALLDRVSRDGGVLRWDFHSERPPTSPNAEACVVFINAYASETFDRLSLTDTFSDNLVRNVADSCSNTIVVIHSAGIRTVDAWIDHPNVNAVLFAGLPGQESGRSLVDVLYGDVNPSGRLPYTVARREADYGDLLNSTTSDEYFPSDDFTEGMFIDYRAFDKKGITPLFEFGFGLSYTAFGYSDMSASRAVLANTTEYPDPAVPIVQGGHPWLWDVVSVVRCTVANSGRVAGAEVAQLYVGIPGDDDETPVRQLRGFRKVGPLEPGEGRTVVFELTRRDLSVWDVEAQQWRLRRGEYGLWVGASSRDFRLKGSFLIE